MLAGGALGGLAVALVAGDAYALQVGAFALVSAGLLGLVRPVARRHLETRSSEQVDGPAAHVGRTGVVTQRVDHRDGRVSLGADVWSARTEYEGAVFEVGETVRVMAIDGPVAVVADTVG
ncbi:NfeD family protein [Modestobacter sp. CPCC 205251]|uniref:NfeD family protein n=2 Tax=Goekera deserti TaxID=2497753 RepID=A0A7K3WF17_9ACTN|nr:NfeD family protein [Goekera deserti]NEL54280.1 NfeD family protein [Goekera deserti]